MVVDLKDAAALARLKGLIANSDVFVENYRPGVAQRLGLGYGDLAGINPRLVYCSITGYGQTGPYAQKGAFDVTVQAMSGLMSVTGEEGRSPAKCGVPVGDFAAGLYGALVTLAAVHKARETGRGAHVDCSMLGALLGIAALQTSEYFGTGVAPKRLGSKHPRNAPYQGFQGSDRAFTAAAGNDKLWRDFCDVVGRPELPEDPRFRTQSLRAKNQTELADLLEPIFVTETAAHWCAALDAKGVPCAPVADYAEILADPHVDHLRLVRDMALPNGAAFRTVGFPVLLSDYDFEISRPPPELGEHTEEVFAEWTQPLRP
jgi:crotonobetainyl-CoA:carnitine CoA-transferase CaiB-like acyl-CoA transferase